MLQAKLIVVGGEVKTKEVSLRLPAVVGRGREATLVLPHALVSRTHCEIYEREGRLYVRDLGSLNGTYVNNYKIGADQVLMPGELLTIGTVTFRADYALATAAAQDEKSPLQSAETPPAMVALETTASPIAPAAPTPRMNDTTVAGRPPFVKKSENNPLRPKSDSHSNQASENPGGSDVLADFSFGESPNKSISLSALEQLPGAAGQVSFVANLENVEHQVQLDPHEPIQIRTADSPESDPNGADDSRLDSFIKKMPK